MLYLDFNTGKYDEKGALKSHLNLELSRFEELYGTYRQEEELSQRF